MKSNHAARSVSVPRRTFRTTGLSALLCGCAVLLSGAVGGRADKVALAFTLAVQGWQNEREVYWPRGKAEDIAPRPWRWGHVTLD